VRVKTYSHISLRSRSSRRSGRQKLLYRRFSSSASGCVRRRFVATCGRHHHRGLRILVGCRVDHARRVPIDHGRRVDFLFTLFDLFLFFLGVELCSSASRRVPRILVSAVATLKLFDCCVGHFGSVPIDKNHRAVHSITASSSRTCDWFSVLHASRVFSHPRSSRELLFFRELPVIIPWPIVANKMGSLSKILAILAVSISLLRRLLVRSYRCLNSALPHVGRSKATINL
jgi:hypothetical protein